MTNTHDMHRFIPTNADEVIKYIVIHCLNLINADRSEYKYINFLKRKILLFVKNNQFHHHCHLCSNSS